jgi:hypothetical protein
MFHPLQQLFKKTASHWDEADISFFIERYLRQELKTEALYCERVHGGVASVRCGSPALQQAALLSEFELQQLLRTETGYELTRILAYVS